MNREAEDRIFRSGAEAVEPQAAAEPTRQRAWLPNLPR